METITEKANNAAKAENKDFGFIEATLADGTPIKLAKQTILDIMKDEIENRAMQDGVFIMYHGNKDNFPKACEPKEWPELEKLGEIAEGVMLKKDKAFLVIAPTESPNLLQWSTAELDAGGFTTRDRYLAMEDWEGKHNTESQFAHVECQPATTAIGFCKNYERVNKNQKGLLKGLWWLPSAAELLLIWANKQKINYALEKITGAKLLTDGWQWCSTEFSGTSAWFLNLENGYFDIIEGKTRKLAVRAVSAFYR